MFAAVLAALLLFSALSGGVETSSPEAQSIKASWSDHAQKQLWQDMEPIPVLKNKDGMVDVEIDLAPSLCRRLMVLAGPLMKRGGWRYHCYPAKKGKRSLKSSLTPGKARNSISAVYQSVPAIMPVSRYTHNETKNDYGMKTSPLRGTMSICCPISKGPCGTGRT